MASCSPLRPVFVPWATIGRDHWQPRWSLPLDDRETLPEQRQSFKVASVPFAPELSNPFDVKLG